MDLIVALDTTSSMVEEIAATERTMNTLLQRLADSGIDARVVLLAGGKGVGTPLFHTDGICIGAPLGSGSCPDDSNTPRYTHLDVPLGDWDILQAYIDQYPRYDQVLRAGSLKMFLAISDGDVDDNLARQMPIHDAETFTAAVAALAPGTELWSQWRYSAVYSFTACGIGNAVGDVHAGLVAQTQGVAGDICTQDFAPIFDVLARQVASSVMLACDWEIPPAPSGMAFAPDKSNLQLTIEGISESLAQAVSALACEGREGWHYDDSADPKRVILCPSSCARVQAAADAQVDLLFGCDTILL